MQVKIRKPQERKLLENTLKRATDKSTGYDLITNKKVTIPPRQTAILPTGLYLHEDLPLVVEEATGTYGTVALQILPRSSTILKYGLIVGNSPGIVDADYTEEIGIVVYNLNDFPQTIEEGTRVAQAIFVPCIFPQIVFVDENMSSDRETRKGFGSTGD